MLRTIGRKVFRVRADNVGEPDQWFLGEPRCPDELEIDARNFTAGVPYHGRRPAVMPVLQPGKELAFNSCAIDMPVVSQRVKEVIQEIAPGDAEFFPVAVPNAQDSYSILNVVCALDCLDESRSEIVRWQPKDNRPDRVGQIHVVSEIRIDPGRIQDHHLFRIKAWPIAVLVTDVLKQALGDIPDLGVVFRTAS